MYFINNEKAQNCNRKKLMWYPIHGKWFFLYYMQTYICITSVPSIKEVRTMHILKKSSSISTIQTFWCWWSPPTNQPAGQINNSIDKDGRTNVLSNTVTRTDSEKMFVLNCGVVWTQCFTFCDLCCTATLEPPAFPPPPAPPISWSSYGYIIEIEVGFHCLRTHILTRTTTSTNTNIVADSGQTYDTIEEDDPHLQKVWTRWQESKQCRKLHRNYTAMHLKIGLRTRVSLGYACIPPR